MGTASQQAGRDGVTFNLKGINARPPHEPSLFSPQIQGCRRLGFLSICGSPESVGKPAFRGSMREDLLGGILPPALSPGGRILLKYLSRIELLNRRPEMSNEQ